MADQIEKNKIALDNNKLGKSVFRLTPVFFSMFVGIVFAGLFSFGIYVLADPPSSPYTPPAPLEPGCAPDDSNCTVRSPVPYVGANTSVNLGAQNLSTTGIGTFGASVIDGTLKILEAGSSPQYYTIFTGGDQAENVNYTLPTALPASDKMLQSNSSGVLSWVTAGSGDVVGPSSATDNAITRFDATTGKLVQNSNATLSDAGNLVLTATSGAQTTLRYDSSNYASFTTGSTGNLTIATTTGTSGGTITFNSAVAGAADATILSNGGTLILGGSNGGNNNNETLILDFDSSANTVAIDSTTGASTLQLNSLNLTTTGTGTFGAIINTDAGVGANCATLGTDSNKQIYCAQASSQRYKENVEELSFDVSKFLSLNPVSFEYRKDLPFKVTGAQVGFIAEDVEPIFPDLVKYNQDNVVEGIRYERLPIYLYQIVKNQQKDIDALNLLAGVINGSDQAVTINSITTKTARVDGLEMVDHATGAIYCTWIQNGELQKTEGECQPIQAQAPAPSFAPMDVPPLESSEVPTESSEVSTNAGEEPVIEDLPEITESVSDGDASSITEDATSALMDKFLQVADQTVHFWQQAGAGLLAPVKGAWVFFFPR